MSPGHILALPWSNFLKAVFISILFARIKYYTKNVLNIFVS